MELSPPVEDAAAKAAAAVVSPPSTPPPVERMDIPTLVAEAMIMVRTGNREIIDNCLGNCPRTSTNGGLLSHSSINFLWWMGGRAECAQGEDRGSATERVVHGISAAGLQRWSMEFVQDYSGGVGGFCVSQCKRGCAVVVLIDEVGGLPHGALACPTITGMNKA